LIIPAFTGLWNHYPHGDASAVKRRIGGNVNLAWVTNTCVIRISYAFNKAGALIPNNVPGLSTIRGGDGKRYAYRVAEFRRFLETRVRPADVRGDVAGQKGIILFEVSGWSDATGHFDLWDGSKCAYSEYFDKASEVRLWRC
jgi:hypothetical protein